MTDTPEITFEEWCKQLDEIVHSYHKDMVSYTEETGADCWRLYYESGCSPEEAYAEDCSYGG